MRTSAITIVAASWLVGCAGQGAPKPRPADRVVAMTPIPNPPEVKHRHADPAPRVTVVPPVPPVGGDHEIAANAQYRVVTVVGQEPDGGSWLSRMENEARKVSSFIAGSE